MDGVNYPDFRPVTGWWCFLKVLGDFDTKGRNYSVFLKGWLFCWGPSSMTTLNATFMGRDACGLTLSRVTLKQRVFRKKSRHVKEGCICFPERRALMKLTCVLPRLLLSLLLFSSPLPSLLPPFLFFSPLSSFSPFPNRDASKGEQVSQNGLPAEQGSPRVSYRSQTYQNYKNFNSRRTASDQPWSGLWSSLPFVKNHSFQILLVWPFGFHFTHSVKNFT